MAPTGATRPVAAKARRVPQIALIGNPNTGKSSVFNGLTGLRQKVGNYPGVTVEKKLGSMHLGDCPCVLIDLPGTYSLAASSPDERVVVDALSGHISGLGQPDLVVCVVEAANLKRNLFLATQVAEMGLPMVIALNLWDEAQAKGLQIDVEKISQRLGVAVVPTVARRGEGFPQLRAAMAAALKAAQAPAGEQKATALARMDWPPQVNEALAKIAHACRANGGGELTLPECHRLLFDAHSAVLERVSGAQALAAVREAIQSGREQLRALGYNPMAAEAVMIYRHLDALLEGTVQAGSARRRHFTEALDRLLVHRVWGALLFLFLMYLVFQSVYTWAGPMIETIEDAFSVLQETFGGWVPESMPVLQSLVTSGLIEGVGAFLVFLPQILILFFFIALLEDTGYMPRAAFLMDKLFGWCGLNGKSFVPMLSSYACAIPGIMSARTIEDPKARMVTVLVAPLMSCSARLPVYVLIIGAFIEPAYGPWVAGFALFAMHFVGLALAIPLAWVLTRYVIRTRPQPFVLEMPPYRFPRLRDVAYRMWVAGKEFVMRAGTVILAMTIIIWALLYFPHSASVEANATELFVAQKVAQGAYSAPQLEALLESGQGESAQELQQELANAVDAALIEQSYMGRAGKFLQPVFAPAGYDWKITVALLASFPAREVVVTTLGVIYSLGGDVDEESGGLRSILERATWAEGPLAGQRVFTIPTALSLMVFFALCMQCGSTVIVLARQLSWQWALFSFCSLTLIAWVCAVLVYQIGSLVV